MRVLEYLRYLHPHPGQAVHVEEPPPIDLVRRRPPPRQPVRLPLQQPVQPVLNLPPCVVVIRIPAASPQKSPRRTPAAATPAAPPSPPRRIARDRPPINSENSRAGASNPPTRRSAAPPHNPWGLSGKPMVVDTPRTAAHPPRIEPSAPAPRPPRQSPYGLPRNGASIRPRSARVRRIPVDVEILRIGARPPPLQHVQPPRIIVAAPPPCGSARCPGSAPSRAARSVCHQPLQRRLPAQLRVDACYGRRCRTRASTRPVPVSNGDAYRWLIPKPVEIRHQPPSHRSSVNPLWNCNRAVEDHALHA